MHKKNIRIYLDLDNTAMDSRRVYDHIVTVISEHGFSREQCEEHFRAIKENWGAYSPAHHVELLARRQQPLDESFLQKIFAFIDRGDMLFPDTLPFLKEFAKEEVIILTLGHQDHQMKKIATHGLKQFVSDIIITLDDKSSRISKANVDLIFFLDDAPREIEAMKKAHPEIFCIQVRTVASWEIQRSTAYADAHAATLTEAAHFIRAKAASLEDSHEK